MAEDRGRVEGVAGYRRPEVSSRDVIGPDDRVRVQDTRLLPWRHICWLDIFWPDGTMERGTGWLVSPRTVITAGHCVHSGGPAATITVAPALDGGAAHFGHTTSTSFRAAHAWVASREDESDYAAIFLDQDEPGTSAGSFDVGGVDDATLSGGDANVCGYPTDLDDHLGLRQYYHSRRISRATDTLLFYDIDTFGGMSGAPIWLRDGERRLVVGMHTTGSPQGNSGIRLHARALADIREWSR